MLSALSALSPTPDTRLRERLRLSFTEGEPRGIFAAGAMSCLPTEGVYEDLSFHENDGPHGFDYTAGSWKGSDRGADRGRWLFTPAFTVFQKGPRAHLVYTSHPSAEELATIDAFFAGHAYTVWLAELLVGDAVRVLEIGGR